MTHQSVRLISVTSGAGPLEGKTGEEIISYCARVSNPSNQDNFDTAGKLLRYCIKNKHWSIFEQAHMTVEIVTSRSVAAQILRHKSFSMQEFSQRYSVVEDFIEYSARAQDSKNRQNSLDTLSDIDKEWFEDSQRTIWGHAQELYKQGLEKGIAKECMRFLLPGQAKTTMYMNGSVRSWIHYLEVRCDAATQKEHREIAIMIRDIFCEQFPHVADALEWRKSE